MAWYPDREDPQLGIGRWHVWLAEHGLDIGLFDDVRARNAKGMDSLADARCFYQLLGALARADAAEIGQLPASPLDLEDALVRPRQQHGKLLTVRGTARRITKINIERPYYRQLIGADHYYEIDVFVPLENQRIRLSRDEQGPEFENAFPVTLCVLRLPPDLEPSDNLNEEIQARAFFFKLWSYESRYVRQFGPRQAQVSPLLVAADVVRVESSPPANPIATAAAVTIIVLVLAGIWFGLWSTMRSDRRSASRLLRERLELPSESAAEPDHRSDEPRDE